MYLLQRILYLCTHFDLSFLNQFGLGSQELSLHRHLGLHLYHVGRHTLLLLSRLLLLCLMYFDVLFLQTLYCFFVLGGHVLHQFLQLVRMIVDPLLDLHELLGDGHRDLVLRHGNQFWSELIHQLLLELPVFFLPSFVDAIFDFVGDLVLDLGKKILLLK